MLWGFISTETWTHGDIFISVQWGFNIDLACKTHHGEQRCSALNLHWHNRSLPKLPHYWPVISFIRPVPSRPDPGLPTTPACGVCEECTKPRNAASPLSARQQNNATNLDCWLLVFIYLFLFRPNKVNSRGENESLAIQQENEMLRHWFTLGSEPQYLIIAMGVWSRPWYFRAGERQYSAVTMLALHESYSLCGLTTIKTERMLCLSQKPLVSVPPSFFFFFSNIWLSAARTKWNPQFHQSPTWF